MATIDLGASGTACRLDLGELIGTRLLVTGNSGAGKSRLLRRLVEQAAGKVQTVIIDPEGEYATLREKHDFMLAGSRGEVPADPRSAALLARRIMELRVSAVLDIYDLRWPDRRAFARNFLESLMSLDREVYRQALVVLDEAHMFCPEQKSGEDMAADSVIALMSQGRKRGLCGCIATQRFSKLHKDASAEANNVFVGRTWQDVDQKRAGDLLGFGLADRQALRELGAGMFYGFGPALAAAGHQGVIQFQAGPVFTTHPKAGQAFKLEPPSPSAKIKAVAGQLQDLPAQAEEAIKTMEAAKAKIRDLERELRQARTAQPPPPPPPPAKEKLILREEHVQRLEKATIAQERYLERVMQQAIDLSAAERASRETAQALLAEFRDALRAAARPAPVPSHPPRPVPPPRPAQVPRPAGTAQDRSDNSGAPVAGLRRMLIALAQRPQGLTRSQLGIRSQVSPRGGSFDTYLSRGRTHGWLVGDGDRFRVTTTGVEILGGYDPLPTGTALRDYWKGQLGGGAARMLDALAAAYPGALSREDLGHQANVSPAGGSYDTYLSRLRSLELVEGKRELKASVELFD